MTAIRDRQREPDADEVAVPWDELPIVGARRGLPWWGAVLLAFGLSLVGAIIDMQSQNGLGWVFRICYFIGAVGAICAVKRRSLFGPMVQPPLALAITVPLVVLLISGVPANSDTLAKALAVGTPLINGFPVMAVATVCTLAIGIARLYRERNPDAPAKAAADDGDAKRPSGSRNRDGASGRASRPARESAGRESSATRARRPIERSGSPRAGEGEQHPSLPLTPRRRVQDSPRRGEPAGRGGSGEPRGDRRDREPGARGDRRDGEPGARSGRTPPPGAARRGRQPRGAAPDDDRRRGGENRDAPGERPRRSNPRGSGEPRGTGEPPRRAPGRRLGPPPRTRRPWDDED
ncbi:DUF6542 domain-containing protein [Amycolatopsis pithecellobii]|uniref:DUF6542 domain-containing protein n=1 Tax=Amycolatopsis pithecellobii TaxID=664692 RepID=A0A6N7Z4M1_9PSEU|nr:DUF6542 domain-containing protein [Amycolatopsis pithecellobii]MTD54196.1 hypothetical protein [Amycolatopsis pithecellobii]